MENYNLLRHKDATIAKLIGKEVKILPGSWDPESGNFEVDHCSNYHYNCGSWLQVYEILDKGKIIEIQEKISKYPNFENASDTEREEVFNLESSAREYMDIKEYPWNGELVDLEELRRTESQYNGFDFCTPDLRFNTGKKCNWVYLPSYSSSLDDIREIETFIIQNKLCESFVQEATSTLGKYFFMHASAEELVDLCIRFLKGKKNG